MKWRTGRIGDFCEITSSKRIFLSDYVEHGVPFWRSKEVIEQEKGMTCSEPLYITKEKYIEIKQRYGVPRTGDMLLTSVGTIGIPYIVKNDAPFYFKDGNLTWFRNFRDRLLSEYLYYWIKSDVGYQTLNNKTIGSSQKALTIDALKKVEMPIPDIETQKYIVRILSAYDDLIENNRRQIKLLEEAAQRLYREWFVELRFPGHEGVKIVDGVPEGWKTQRLFDFADVVMGQSPKSEYYNTDGEGLPFHQGVGTYGYRFVLNKNYSSQYTRVAEAGSILFSVRAPVGRLNYTKEKIAIGRGLAAMNHKDGYQHFLYYMLKEKFFKEDILGNGSIFASITKDELLSQKFTVPFEQIVKLFNEISGKLDRKIEVLDAQSKMLIEARDKLLPKLTSGETEAYP